MAVTPGVSSIAASDYNSLRSNVSSVLVSCFNQTMLSSDVTGFAVSGLSADKVDHLQVERLFLDIQRCHVHQTGTASVSIAVPTTGYIVGADTAEDYDTATGARSAVVDGNKMGYNDYEVAVQTIVNFDGSVSGWPVGNFTLGTPQSSLTRSTSWGGTGDPASSIYHVITVTFSSTTHMNSYFCAGGELQFNASLTGGSSSKDSDWAALLSAMGTIKFNKYRITATSGTPTPTVSGGSGYDSLTGSYRQLFIKSGSGVYANNEYTIEGYKVGNILRFRISMNDDYSGPFTDASVTGNVNSSCVTFRPDSSFVYNLTNYTAVSIVAPTLATAVNLTENYLSPPA